MYKEKKFMSAKECNLMVTEPSEAHITSSLVSASKVIFTAVAPGNSTIVYWSREFSYGCWVHEGASSGYNGG